MVTGAGLSVRFWDPHQLKIRERKQHPSLGLIVVDGFGWLNALGRKPASAFQGAEKLEAKRFRVSVPMHLGWYNQRQILAA